jgi:S1-C subfamily serine protease
VTVKVQRGDEEKEILVTTQALSDMRGKEVEFPDWGFTASELTPGIVRRAQLSSNKGVLISGVQVGGIAGNAGLNQGDVALKLDNAEIDGIDAFASAVKERIGAKTKLVLLQVKRGALTRFVIVKQGEPVIANDAPQADGGIPNEK